MRKLTPEEIKATVAKIRDKYDEYIRRYVKAKNVRIAFEDRYLEALRHGVDISSFLIAEIGAVEELIRREEARLAGPAERVGGDEPAYTPSATDEILEKQRKMIVGYRNVPFHRDADEEVKRMLGALSTLLAVHWVPLQEALRETAYSSHSNLMSRLDHELRHLGSEVRDEVSPALTHYVLQLKSFPRDTRSLEREEKSYLLASSFLLHELEDLLNRVSEAYAALGEDNLRVVRAALSFVSGIIDNFRLRHLKRRK